MNNGIVWRLRQNQGGVFKLACGHLVEYPDPFSFDAVGLVACPHCATPTSPPPPPPPLPEVPAGWTVTRQSSFWVAVYAEYGQSLVYSPDSDGQQVSILGTGTHALADLQTILAHLASLPPESGAT